MNSYRGLRFTTGFIPDDASPSLGGARNSTVSGRMQFRLYDGAAGDPVVSVSTAPTSGSRIIIDRFVYVELYPTELAALPRQPGLALGAPTVLRYDLLLSIAGIGENVCFFGDAMIRDGVTR